MSGCNVVILRGTLSRAPEIRVLPSGDALVNYEVTTHVDAGAISVPVCSVGERVPLGLDAGDEVVVTGLVRRRFFRVGGVTQSRTEVVADVVVPARQSARARRAVERAIEVAEPT